ncbi:hypothetical protein [Neisseria yangbaofengii]|nr:hypothetical protein [Neisseria yangbaofengii]
MGQFAMPDFQGERPDPMPGYEFTGNPVSIAFTEQAGHLEMRSFKLYQGEKEITRKRVLRPDTTTRTGNSVSSNLRCFPFGLWNTTRCIGRCLNLSARVSRSVPNGHPALKSRIIRILLSKAVRSYRCNRAGNIYLLAQSLVFENLSSIGVSAARRGEIGSIEAANRRYWYALQAWRAVMCG